MYLFSLIAAHINIYNHFSLQHLPDGSAPSAHVEFYLLPYPSEARRRKTKSVPKCTDPTYNEIVSILLRFDASEQEKRRFGVEKRPIWEESSFE